jgi:(1->4)-alpha-D-glucan 1-alpha-D-glucosylmutase
MNDDERQEYTERILQYMEKALREAKLHTSWMNPSEDYEAAVFDFVRKILGPEAVAFQTDLGQFVGGIADAGFVNALSQVVLKLTLPGAPDFYQGAELWDFSLVDPDNRRPVDFAARQSAWEELESARTRGAEQLARDLAAQWPDPRVKLLVTARGLAVRNRWPDIFHSGLYSPLETRGPLAEHLFAYARHDENRFAITITPRHFHRVTHSAGQSPVLGSPRADWGDTAIVLPENAAKEWCCEFSGRTLQVATDNDTLTLRAADLFEVLPVALLTASKE